MKLMYVVIMTLMIFSCQRYNDEQAHEKKDVELNNVELTTDSIGIADEERTSSNEKADRRPPKVPAEPPIDWTQKIIKTANISVELKDYHAYNNTVPQSIATYGAYIAQEQQQEDEAQITNDLSIRVPVEKFESLVGFLTADKKNKILQKQISSADVTAEFADIKARLETKKQVRAKYQQFMSDARKMDDVLALQAEINNITEDIEAATARVKSLGHQSAYSTINLRYFQVMDAKAIDNKEPGFGIQLVNAIRSGASFVGELVIILVSVWPLIVIGLIAWYFIKRSRLLKTRPQAK